MKKSFLEYYKEILEKVSFDPQLLTKEYHKAIKLLKQSELQEFEEWVNERGIGSVVTRIDASQNHIFRP